jgi:hypothetical protein
MSIQVTLVYNKANPFGIRQDSLLLESVLRTYNSSQRIEFAKVKHADLLEPPVPCDVAIHLEIPSTAWLPFAHKNVLMVNSEWWVPAWNCLLPKFDLVLVKQKGLHLSGTFVPWNATVNPKDFERYPASTEMKEALWLLGGSTNKRSMAEAILPYWKADYPKLHVYTTQPLNCTVSENVEVNVKDLSDDSRKQLQRWYPIHVCLSRSEGFGLAAVEAEAAGAFVIVNDIPAYKTSFEGKEHVGWIQIPTQKSEKYTSAEFADCSGNLQSILDQFDSVFVSLKSKDSKLIRMEQADANTVRAEQFTSSMMPILKNLAESVHQVKQTQKGNRHLPPYLDNADCPPISIVTLTYNRRKFIDLAFHNIILADYPKDKIEWVIVDDSDKPEEAVSDKVATFAKRAPCEKVVYVPLTRKSTIGFKRNIGVDRATNEIILFMDDDDHYPESSFRRRVAWLTKHPWKPQCVGCATIACYDLVKGVSAVNTPPWELGPAQRVSEATLTFYKSFWQEQKFPQVSMAEGEAFLKGRESAFMEIPPQQILVAFSHQGNSSGRRIPAPEDMKPGCFWQFPKEYLIWIHKLAGIEVEEEKETRKSKKSK